ncbi:MAG: FAD-binding oxidoreductase [Pseudomonadota bacterium]
MMLPPGVSEPDFRAALQEFSQIVGEKWVFADEESIKLYTDPYSPKWGQEDDLRASGAVAPNSTEQVSAILKTANKYRIPIYAFSTGKNLGYGGGAPVYSGSVMLDLKRMNKILEINDKQHYAIVEPGVTLFDLYKAIQDRGYKLSMEMMDPGWGSVIGNALDHGCAHTTTYGRDRFHDHCGMEVVLPNGDVVRLGMGALPDSGMSAQFHYGFGPYVDGMFSQSNFGVVTQMGFHLRPEHEAYRSGFIQVPKFADLERLIEVECLVTHSGIANGMTHLGSPVQGPPMGASKETFAAFMKNKELMSVLAVKGRPDSAKLERYGRENNLGFWSADIKFHGPEKIIEAQWDYCKEKFLEIPGAWVEDHGPVVTFPMTKEQEVKLNTEGNAEKVHLGIPSLNRFEFQAFLNDLQALPSAPSTGHLYFAPMIPKTAEQLLKAQEVFYDAMAELGIKQAPGHFGRMPIGWYYRSFIYLIAFNVTKNEEINRQTFDAYRALIKLGAEHGWGEYRTHALFQDDVMNVYNWNDHALVKLHETIKDALDPNGILAAGKSGVWPKHLRGTRT